MANADGTCTLLPSTSDPAKNTAQPCTNNPASKIAAAQQTACTNPINSGTGNKYQREVDYVGLGVYPLKLERHYNSGGTTPSAVEAMAWGSQWRSTHDRSIAVNTGGGITTATVKREGGKQYYFNLINGTWVGDADIVGALVRLTDASGVVTGWTYASDNDETETYDAAGKFISIANRAGLTQALTYSDGTTGANGGYVLGATGTPTATALPAGRMLRVTDPAGRTLQFGYDAAARVVKMTDPAGGNYLYGYSGPLPTDNLTSITYPDSKVRTYLYGEAANVSATPAAGVSYTHSLTGILDENSARYASWTYDAQGRATSSEHGASGSGIDHVGLAYGTPDASGNSTTTVTDTRGNVRGYGFATTLGVVRNTGITGQPCNGCNAALAYDANGNVASRTDFNSNQTTYVYDPARNLETSRTEGLAAAGAVTPATRTINTTWHPAYRLPLTITEQDASTATTATLRTTTLDYDASGNLINKTIADPVANVSRSWAYTYDTLGHRLTEDGPRTDVNDVTTYAYYPPNAACVASSAPPVNPLNPAPNLGCRGQLLSVRNALYQTTTLDRYNHHGQVEQITDPNGLVTALTYDIRQRLTARTVGVGGAAPEATGYGYDGVGQLIAVTPPNMAAISYTYDAAHRLTDITDAPGNHIRYTLDNMGNRTREETFDGLGNLVRTHSREFDALNRLWHDIGAINQTTTYEHGPNGNLTGVSGPLNHRTLYQYDALNRLTGSIDAANGSTAYGFDALDQLAQVTDPMGLVTRYQRDGLGNLARQISPDTGASARNHDGAGNVIASGDAIGQTATHTYDALDRPIQTAYAAPNSAPAVQVDYQYDTGSNAIGKLARITETENAQIVADTAYTYDGMGRLASQADTINGVAYTTGYRYDSAGQLIGLDYPGGRSLDYTLDSVGRIRQITTTRAGLTQALASNITYQTFGKSVIAYTLGNGRAVVRQLDQDGAVASYTLSDTAQNLEYDAAGRMARRTNSANPLYDTSSYAYDALDRLTDAIMPAAAQSYTYDANGNRMSATAGAATGIYAYAPGSNRLDSVTRNNTVRGLTHDANGSITADGVARYGYDLRGRKARATGSGGATAQYRHNALGQRTLKTTTGIGATLYHYDKEGKLIGESDAAGNTLREYIYLDGAPIAVWE